MSKLFYPTMVDVADGKQVRVESEGQHQSAYPEDYKKAIADREREEQLVARTTDDMIHDAAEAALNAQEKKFQVFLDQNKAKVDANLAAAVADQKERDAAVAESFQQSGKVVSAKIAAAIRGVAYVEAPATVPAPASGPAPTAETK